MSEKEKSDKEKSKTEKSEEGKPDDDSWRQNLLRQISMDESSKQDEKVHPLEEEKKWHEACEKVFHSVENFDLDVTELGETAYAYRRASLQVNPVRARVQDGLPLIDDQHGAIRDPEGGMPSKRYFTIAGDLSNYIGHNQEVFPRVHQIMSRIVPDLPLAAEVARTPRTKRISTGPGMPTIRDEDGGDDEEDGETDFNIVTHGETESEAEMEKYPHEIRNRGKRMSTDFTTDDDEHIYIRPKVKFNQTETETEDQEAGVYDEDERISKKKKQQKRSQNSNRRRRNQYSEAELESRRVQGSDLISANQMSDLEDLEYMVNSHRSDPLGALTMSHVSRMTTSSLQSNGRNFSDLSWTQEVSPAQQKAIKIPKELFVQMDELRGDEWQEQARYIKYEEHVLDGADRWGRAHIASLSFHSVINLRLVLDSSVLLLHMPSVDYRTIIFRLVEEFAFHDNELSLETKNELVRTLLLPRRFVGGQTLPAMGKIGSELQFRSQMSENGISKLQTSPSSADVIQLASTQKGDNIMQKLVPGTEGSSTLVGTLETIKKPLVGFIRFTEATVMPNLLEVPIPVRFIFVLFIPKTSLSMDCHEIGRAFSTLMNNKKFQKVCCLIEQKHELLNSISNFLDETVVLPPGDWDKKNLLSMADIMELKRKKRLRLAAMERLRKEDEEKSSLGKTTELTVIEHVEEEQDPEKKKKPGFTFDPLVRTRIPFGGIINEFRQRFPYLKSDVTDSFNVMCLAATIFIFFAAFAGAIAFGGLLERKTEGYIGIPETLIVSSVCACIFHLFAGQPVVLIGVTGPVMVFDEALYKFTKNAEVEFLTTRVWIAIWCAVIALGVAAFQGSVVVRYYTKFTKDIFIAFVASVFIIEALLQTAGFFSEHPPIPLVDYCLRSDVSAYLDNLTSFVEDYSLPGNHTHIVSRILGTEYPVFGDEPNTAFKSLILQFCTFGIAYYFRSLKSGKAFGRRIRRFLGDFGLPLSIVLMVAIDKVFPFVHTQLLNIPDGLEVTSPAIRGWFISPWGTEKVVPLWIPFISIIPALLLYILLFVNCTLCQLILMEKCKKSSGLHWDIVLICLLNVPTTLVGGPWMCVALVRSVTHLSVLTVWSTNHAPGESPKFVEVKDQRVTGFVIHLFVGLAILLAPVLREIPMAVVFGVFLYLGICSLNGVDFVDRVYLFFYPPKHHPSTPYVQQVRTWKMHLYTLCQAFGLAILWIVKSTPAAIFFPFFVMFMVPYRYSLKYLFTEKELQALDGGSATKAVKKYDEIEPEDCEHGMGA